MVLLALILLHVSLIFLHRLSYFLLCTNLLFSSFTLFDRLWFWFDAFLSHYLLLQHIGFFFSFFSFYLLLSRSFLALFFLVIIGVIVVVVLFFLLCVSPGFSFQTNDPFGRTKINDAPYRVSNRN